MKRRQIVEMDHGEITQGVAYLMLSALFIFNFHYVELHTSLASNVTWILDIMVGGVFFALGCYKIFTSSRTYRIGRRGR